MIVGYAIVCSCVWAMFQTISEITIAFPTSGNFIDYADRFVDPALAFSAGFAEWLGKIYKPRFRYMFVDSCTRVDSCCSS